jgi:hypothetical protein
LVGIGTASPSGTLDVQAANAGQGIRLTATTGTNGASYKATTGAGNLYMGIDTSSGGSFGKANSAVLWYDAAQPMVFANNNAERMRIDTSGRVGIGTASPATSSAGLHVVHDATEGTPSFPDGEVIIAQRNFNSSQGCHIAIIGGSAGESAINFGDKDDSDVGNITYNHSANRMEFAINASERMRIDSSGRLFLGTSSQIIGTHNHKLGVVAAGVETPISTDVNETADRYAIDFHNPNGRVGNILTNGTSTSFNTSSDARLKEVTGEARGLEVINELNPVAYNWKADGKADEGLIAQEVKELVPNAVSGSEEEMYSMDYSKLVVHLVKAVKELSTEVDELKKQLEK